MTGQWYATNHQNAASKCNEICAREGEQQPHACLFGYIDPGRVDLLECLGTLAKFPRWQIFWNHQTLVLQCKCLIDQFMVPMLWQCRLADSQAEESFMKWPHPTHPIQLRRNAMVKVELTCSLVGIKNVVAESSYRVGCISSCSKANLIWQLLARLKQSQ